MGDDVIFLSYIHNCFYDPANIVVTSCLCTRRMGVTVWGVLGSTSVPTKSNCIGCVLLPAHNYAQSFCVLTKAKKYKYPPAVWGGSYWLIPKQYKTWQRRTGSYRYWVCKINNLNLPKGKILSAGVTTISRNEGNCIYVYFYVSLKY